MASGFGERLRQLRKRANISQQALAERARVSISSVTKAEQGVTEPTWATIVAFAKALGVPTDAFRDDVELPPASEKPKKGKKKK